MNRLLLKKVLTKGGFQLAEAVNGREAYEKWSEWKPHLILMDEDMPIMKGSEATVAILNECHPDTAPVIISLTAYAFKEAREKAMAFGCKDFISRPFKANELYATIAKHLSLKYTYADKVPEVETNSEPETEKA
ncbi:MAG: response regulator [Verrucomicrobiales bacterium]